MHAFLSHILFSFDAMVWHALREARNVVGKKIRIKCLEVEELQYYLQANATTALLALLNLMFISNILPAKDRERTAQCIHILDWNVRHKCTEC